MVCLYEDCRLREDCEKHGYKLCEYEKIWEMLDLEMFDKIFNEKWTTSQKQNVNRKLPL